MATPALPYLSLSGTSMAAPVVSGTIALMLQANPDLTPDQVKAILQYTAQPYAGYDILTQGAGFLDAAGPPSRSRSPSSAHRPLTIRRCPTGAVRSSRWLAACSPAAAWSSVPVTAIPSSGARATETRLCGARATETRLSGVRAAAIRAATRWSGIGGDRPEGRPPALAAARLGGKRAAMIRVASVTGNTP